jgi:hypothetical protein
MRSLLLSYVLLNTVTSGQSYSDFRSGAAAVSFAIENGAKSLSREQQDNFLLYSTYMRGFLYGIKGSSLVIDRPDTKGLLVPDEWMLNPGKSAPSFLAFVARHQPENFDKSNVDTEGLTKILVAWYLDSHSKHERSLNDSATELRRLEQLNTSDKVTTLSDAELRQLMVGKWTTGRHDYDYEADGTWRMLPADASTTKGTWRIEDHKLIEGTDARTIIEATREQIVLRNQDGAYPYRYLRIDLK